MSSDLINIQGLPKAEVLAALFNAASPQGLGFVNAAGATSSQEMTVEQARQCLQRGQGFDYLYGRCLKVNLEEDTFDPWLYDRDNGGPGTAEIIIERLRATGAVSSSESTQNREGMTAQHAHEGPLYAEAGEKVARAKAMWDEIVADGLPEVPFAGMTARQHLDWASDQALKYFDKGEHEKTLTLFLALVDRHPDTAWIATHELTLPMLMSSLHEDRSRFEYMLKGFSA